MRRLGLSMRSECKGPQTAGCDPQACLEAQCHCLQLLVSELLLKNQELRFEVARLSQEVKSPRSANTAAAAGPSRSGCFFG
jgi:hypothetical protein